MRRSGNILLANRDSISRRSQRYASWRYASAAPGEPPQREAEAEQDVTDETVESDVPLVSLEPSATCSHTRDSDKTGREPENLAASHHQ